MQSLLEDKGLSSDFLCDSAGTSAHHAGEPADARMRHHAEKRGYSLASRSRLFIRKDFEEFDYIFTMDDDNYENVQALDQQSRFHDKVFSITSFCQKNDFSEVPDPYYGGSQGFELVLDLLEDACEGIFQQLLK